MFSFLNPKIDVSSDPSYDEIYAALTSEETSDEDRKTYTAQYNVLISEALQEAKAKMIKKIKAGAVLVGAVLVVSTILVLAAGSSDEEDSEEEDETLEEN